MKKFSKQRQEVLKTVRENLIHPTADEVYRLTREKDPSISLGTVYRNLNGLAEEGEIRRLPMPDGKCRFDGRTDDHCHAICRSCGKVIDFSVDLSTLGCKLKEENQFRLSGYEFVAYGFCAECQKQL